MAALDRPTWKEAQYSALVQPGPEGQESSRQTHRLKQQQQEQQGMLLGKPKTKLCHAAPMSVVQTLSHGMAYRDTVITTPQPAQNT